MNTYIRKIDSANRLKIPKKVRETLKIAKGESIEIFLDNTHIILKKFPTKIN